MDLDRNRVQETRKGLKGKLVMMMSSTSSMLVEARARERQRLESGGAKILDDVDVIFDRQVLAETGDPWLSDRLDLIRGDGSLPWPSVSYVWSRRHVIRGADGIVRSWEGWLNTETGECVSERDVHESLEEGLVSEKEVLVFMERQAHIAGLKMRMSPSYAGGNICGFYDFVRSVDEGGVRKSRADLDALYSLMKNPDMPRANVVGIPSSVLCLPFVEVQEGDVLLRIDGGLGFHVSRGQYSSDGVRVFSAQSGRFLGRFDGEEVGEGVREWRGSLFFLNQGVWRDEIPGWNVVGRDFGSDRKSDVLDVLEYGSRYFGDESFSLDVRLPDAIVGERFPSLCARQECDLILADPISDMDVDLDDWDSGQVLDVDILDAEVLVREGGRMISVRGMGIRDFGRHSNWLQWACEHVEYLVVPGSAESSDWNWVRFDPDFLFGSGI